MIRLIRLAFWAAALFALVMAALPRPPELHVWDKWQHMAAFVVLTVLGRAAYPRLGWTKLMLALVAFGGLIELVQMLPEIHRDSQLSDWLADIIAVVAALAAAGLIERIRRARAD
jgi:hypothetical protein